MSEFNELKADSEADDCCQIYFPVSIHFVCLGKASLILSGILLCACVAMLHCRTLFALDAGDRSKIILCLPRSLFSLVCSSLHHSTHTLIVFLFSIPATNK